MFGDFSLQKKYFNCTLEYVFCLSMGNGFCNMIIFTSKPTNMFLIKTKPTLIIINGRFYWSFIDDSYSDYYR